MASKKEKVEEALTRGVEKVYPSKAALRKALLTKRLRLYQGFDPSMPSLHLGNLVGVLKLRQFQELGHEAIFLVGDFTGMIGDPTDKLAARKKLTREQVLDNCQNWKKQVEKILSFTGKNPARFMFNSQWSDEISFKDLIEITSHFTVQQMIQRDFFQKRIIQKRPIFLHEFLYPVAQAIDCVKMDVDLEIGGSDQTFNMLAGRHLMKALKNKEKFVLTTKLLVGKEGAKVGKTTGNALFLDTPAPEMFGAIMAFTDQVIVLGMELLTLLPLKEIGALEKRLKQEKVSPMLAKKKLAFEIVKLVWGKTEAENAQKEFEIVFQKRALPSKMPEMKLGQREIGLLDLLIKTKLAPSKSEAKRLILQKGVKINGQKVSDWQKIIELKKGQVLQVGKRRFCRLQ